MTTEVKVKHTSGPWTCDGSHVYAPDGAILAVVSNPGSRESDYSLVANRDLISAAPEMASALAMAYEAMSESRGFAQSTTAIKMRAALEKAGLR